MTHATDEQQDPASSESDEDRSSGGTPTASRHYRRARRDRGADTRAQLIDAALTVFGRVGFDAATTREIAKLAGANLAAIVYHFGSKEALYLTVARHVAAQISGAAGPALAAAADPASVETPAAAAKAITALLETYVDIILGSADAERWSRFIVREQMEPSTAFEVIYRIMGGATELAAQLVAAATGRPNDEEARMRVFSLFGQILIFRVAQALVLRRMGWTAIGERERGEIKRLVAGHVAAIIEQARRE